MFYFSHFLSFHKTIIQHVLYFTNNFFIKYR
uniref:Uncharacterized protein n=1 Tax=Siphoviridae sp. ctl0E3 TaxID=2827586 RepID=A0A8S5LNX8_9CAUD|nr:MAG TPA: hypothetical protein [Siphoviridae sp. ctl0E3]DAO04986.1 MAG TPA: hypothetical protein [Caudoviricetes sp.]DAR53835.1 MAG TPA: hypothetical protein [Caudoviricetes sp.]